MTNKLTAIIVNWNTNDSLAKLLNTLSSSSTISLVVIDNNSTVKPTALAKKYQDVTFIFNDVNKGYAAACNQGALFADGDWLFFLNADVAIDNKLVSECLNEMEERKLDAASPLSEKEGYNKPLPSILSLIVEFSPLRNIVPLSWFKKKTLFGGALLIKKSVFLKLQGWDERFFVWFEDSDITKRLYQADARVGWLHKNVAHTGGTSFTNLSKQVRSAIFFQSLAVYLRKHHGVLGRLCIQLLTRRFWHGVLYPQLHNGMSLIIPNMKKDILEMFLKKNEAILKKVDEVIVVSSDLDPSFLWKLRETYDSIRFIPLRENNGFAHTVNVGFRAATGKYIATCNDDTILNSNTFSYIDMLPSDTGSANPLIKNPDGSIESAGISILQKGKAEVVKVVGKEPFTAVTATNGACVIYERKALEKVGIFDEGFGSYLEDIDLSLRLSQAGYINYVYNAAEITHQKHQTSKSLGAKKQWLDLKNWILIIAKHWSLKTILLNFPQIVTERLRNISGLLKAL